MSRPCVPVIPPPYVVADVADDDVAPAADDTTPLLMATAEQIEILVQQGFTRPLARSLLDTTKLHFVLRIWIVDNSGSMQHVDGHRLVDTGNRTTKMVSCTRWAELADTVEYHIQLADLIQAPTRFRFLNNPHVVGGHQSFGVGGQPVSWERSFFGNPPQLDAAEATRLLRTVQPEGCTPLSEHIREIRHELTAVAPILRQAGQRVVVIIATDGLPTDSYGNGGEVQQREFVDALRLLEGLPIWLVIRLCTDEAQVADFYNNLDSELELSIDVLDDFVGEAEEIHQKNPWLTYGLPLHRMREMGFQDRVLDLIDERSFGLMEIHHFLSLLFGPEVIGDPHEDWNAFVRAIHQLNAQEQQQWNPIKRKMMPWIDVPELKRCHGGASTGWWNSMQMWFYVLVLGLILAGLQIHHS